MIIFFKHFYNFTSYKNNLLYKYKIPTYNWVESKQKRALVILQSYDENFIRKMPEDYMQHFFHNLSKGVVVSKYKYYYRYIYKKFPYRLNKKYKDLEELYNSFYKLSKIGLKSYKKYHFLKQSKISHYDKYHGNLLEQNEKYMTIYFEKVKHWDHPFVRKHLNTNIIKNKLLSELDPWSYIYYTKCNKYYAYKYKNIYNNKHYINLLFIKHYRKDYFWMRQHFLRILSRIIYNTSYKMIRQPELYPAALVKESNKTENKLIKSIYYKKKEKKLFRSKTK